MPWLAGGRIIEGSGLCMPLILNDVPVDGALGTVGYPTGARALDQATGLWYSNTGSEAAPVWTGYPEQGATLPSGPWGQWDFGATVGQVVSDLSGNNRNLGLGFNAGVAADDPTLVSAAYLSFDGGDGVLGQSDGSKPYTLIVVARAANHNFGNVMGWSREGAGANRGQLQTTTTTTFAMTGLTTVLQAPDGTWPAATWAMLSTRIIEGGAGSLEYNGALVASAATMGTVTLLECLMFGARGDFAGNFFTGDIAYALVYNRILSDPELLDVYAFLQAELADRGIVLP